MNKQKIRIGLLFGGRTGEHEVSLQSAKSIYDALDKERYDIVPIGIDKQGQWRLGSGAHFLLNTENPRLIKLNDSTKPVTAVITNNQTELIETSTHTSQGKIDIFFSIIHGTYGEDGSLQGLFEILGTPYVGAGVLGSAIGMDKDVMKRLLIAGGLPVARYRALSARLAAEPNNQHKIIEELGLPLFVKPANAGSSVGITKVKNTQDLSAAVVVASHYDTKIIFEEAVTGRELECAVLGNQHPEASLAGEIVPTHEFYSYEAKYIDEHGAALTIPANISKETLNELQTLAVQAFQILECAGMARVDFFLKSNGELIVNEINTLPGFTKISMYPKLWAASGLPYPKLLDRLIELALERHAEKLKLKRDYEPSE